MACDCTHLVVDEGINDAIEDAFCHNEFSVLDTFQAQLCADVGQRNLRVSLENRITGKPSQIVALHASLIAKFYDDASLKNMCSRKQMLTRLIFFRPVLITLCRILTIRENVLSCKQQLSVRCPSKIPRQNTQGDDQNVVTDLAQYVCNKKKMQANRRDIASLPS